VLFWTKEIPIGRVELVEEEEVLSDLRRSRDTSRGVFVTKTKWFQVSETVAVLVIYSVTSILISFICVIKFWLFVSYEVADEPWYVVSPGC
jgi:hypothetical protein